MAPPPEIVCGENHGRHHRVPGPGRAPGVIDPDLGKDIVSLGFVTSVSIDGGRVAATVELTTPACPVKDQLKESCRQRIQAIPGVTDVDVTMTAQVRSHRAGGAEGF